MIFKSVHSRLFLDNIGTCRSNMSVGIEGKACLNNLLIVSLYGWLFRLLQLNYCSLDVIIADLAI
jgi:hypothetical protein